MRPSAGTAAPAAAQDRSPGRRWSAPRRSPTPATGSSRTGSSRRWTGSGASPERVHERHAHQRVRADDACDRGARGPRRRRAPGRARAQAGRAPVRVAAVPGAARGAPRGTPTRARRARSTLRAGSRTWRAATAPCTSRSTRRWRAPSITRGARASSSSFLPRPSARMVQCVRSVANSPFFRYPNIRLNQINFAAEIQACAVSMTDDPSAAAPRLPAAADPVPARCEAGRAPVAHPEPGAELQLPPQSLPARGRATEHRVGRVRQHRARRPLLLRAGARARDEADLRGPWAHAAGLRAARAVRLLDAQRLPELGHGPLPVPLAPVALLGVVVPGPARDRQLEELRPTRTSGAGRSTCSTAR